MKSKIPTVLALYKLNLLSKSKVIEWADQQLLNESEPFTYISELSLKGPDICLKMPNYAFPRVRELSYYEEFSLRLVKLNENYDSEVINFVQWAACAAMGLDIKQPEVHLGYLVDHYFFECDDLNFADNYLKTAIADLLPECQKTANSIWQEIA